MSEKKLPLPKIPENPTEILEGPLKLIENFDSTIQTIDKVLKSFDNVIASADSRLLSKVPEPTIERAEHVASPSYPGQSQESYCLECLPAKTIVYGNHGLYTIEKLGSVNLGAKLRVLTHKGRGKNVLRFFSRKYEGPIIRIFEYYTNIPLRITPEHPILAAKGVRKTQTVWQDKGIDESALEWVPVKDLTTSDFIAFPRIKETQDVSVVNGDLAELFGWYVAEGSYEKVRRGINITFSLGHHEKENIENVSRLIRSLLGVEPTIITGGTATRITFSSKYFGPMFEQFGRNAHDKDIPTWFLHLPEEKQYKFLRGYFGGDGHIKNSKHRKKEGIVKVSVATVSRGLAYRLRLLLFRLGILHSVTLKKGSKGIIQGREVEASDTYFISVSGGAAMKLLDKMGVEYDYEYNGGRRAGYNFGWVGENYVFLPIRKIETEEFKGAVYNVHVEEDESYLTIQGALHNCLSRHYLKAYGLLEEAERFSLGKGEITPEARQRIEAALKEIVTAEEDLGTEIRDAELAKMIDEIKTAQREFRKWTWTERLLTTQRDISKLREAISRMKSIVEATKKAAEYYDSKYGRCSYCEMLASEISSRFGLNEREILDSIYGLASDNKERVSESAEKLKRLGVFEYTMQRVKEMLTELKEGK